MIPGHMLHEPRLSPAQESRWAEYGWLGTIRANIRRELDEVIKYYGAAGGDHNVEAAISEIESALDRLYRRCSTLDEGDA